MSKPDTKRKVTIREIAKLCGVSVATVSNVLNGKPKASEDTVSRVMKIVEEQGYRQNDFARGLRTKRTGLIAVVVEDIGLFTTSPIISAITQKCEEEGYRIVLYNMRLYGRWSDTWYDRDEDWRSVLFPILKKIRASHAEGLVYLAGHARHIPQCPLDGLPPAVMCYSMSDRSDVPSVVVDDEGAASEIAGVLTGAGHRRIGFIGGREDNIHTRLRLAGYRSALRDAGITYDPSLVCYTDWTRESGCEAAKELDKNGVSAIFCSSDRIAGGVYDYLYMVQKRVGEDISVTGFDDEIIASYMRPPLTTMALPLYQTGLRTAELLFYQMAKGEMIDAKADSPQVYRLPCILKYRESVQRARCAL